VSNKLDTKTASRRHDWQSKHLHEVQRWHINKVNATTNRQKVLKQPRGRADRSPMRTKRYDRKASQIIQAPIGLQCIGLHVIAYARWFRQLNDKRMAKTSRRNRQWTARKFAVTQNLQQICIWLTERFPLCYDL